MYRAFKPCLAVVCLLLLSVAGASAARGGGGGGFWEKMSGPGEWFWVSGFLGYCGKLDTCSLGRSKVWLNFAASYATTGAEDEGDVKNPRVHAIAFEPSVDYTLFTVRGYPVRVGGGVGVYRFFGDDVGFTRLSLEPRASVAFLRRAGLYFELRYALKVFVQGFDASDFGDPTGTFTTDGADSVHTLSISFVVGR